MPSDLNTVISSAVGGPRRGPAPARRSRRECAIRRTASPRCSSRHRRIRRSPRPLNLRRGGSARPAPAASPADSAGTRRRTRRARRLTTHASSITGVGDEVTSTIRSAPRTAASAESAATIGAGDVSAHVLDELLAAALASATRCAPASAAARADSASRWLRACTPLPMIASVDASGSRQKARRYGRHRGGSGLGDVAAIHHRLSAPVSGSSNRIVARCDGRLRLVFSPNTVTSFAPRLAGAGT